MAPWPKHLDVSSECPSLDKNKVAFINMRYCPFAQRTALVLEAKNIPYEMINVHLKSKPKWFLEKNPLGKVPTIQIGDDIIYESIPVCDYLDAIYPGRQLNPQTPLAQAQDKMVLARYDGFMGNFYKLLRADSERQKMLNDFQESLKFLEDELNKRGSTFFHGNDEPKMLDYMIWPWIERLEVFPKLHPDLTEIMPENQFPKLKNWTEKMMTDSAVKAYFLDSKTHLDFYNSYVNGVANYDPEI